MMKKKTSLYNALTEYSSGDFYPFHMPGHKRRMAEFANPWSLDITEIDGFDNLHHATGILQDLQERTAELFHSDLSFVLVNGSTCGLLTAISACVKPCGKLLLSRNCHKAVYHGIELRNITPVYLMPDMTNTGICGSLHPDQVQQALEKHPDISAVLVVSPTYDGVVSDVKSIADIAHAHGIPLIVDEAHGAHFPLSDHFPASAIACGADVVIQSLHKTLPAFTQTAVLHLNSDLVKETDIRRFLGIYQSSSPSYLLMASADLCLQVLREEGTERFHQLHKNLEQFYKKAEHLSYIECFTNDKAIFDRDPSKLLISAQKLGLSGPALAELLRKDYHLEMEMASGHYVVALCSLMDTAEGFSRLLDALRDLETRFSGKKSGHSIYTVSCEIPTQILTPADAMQREATEIPLEEAAGCISQEYIYLYPPGIPLVVPGEEIDEKLLASILAMRREKMELNGLADLTNQRINIVIS